MLIQNHPTKAGDGVLAEVRWIAFFETLVEVISADGAQILAKVVALGHYLLLHLGHTLYVPCSSGVKITTMPPLIFISV